MKKHVGAGEGVARVHAGRGPSLSLSHGEKEVGMEEVIDRASEDEEAGSG